MQAEIFGSSPAGCSCRRRMCFALPNSIRITYGVLLGSGIALESFLISKLVLQLGCHVFGCFLDKPIRILVKLMACDGRLITVRESPSPNRMSRSTV